MPRSLWSGAISFGLVNIPVRLEKAVAPRAIRFHQVHDTDGARIVERRFCSVEEEVEVPWTHVAKGYELEPGHFVVLRNEELNALDERAGRAIEIERFVDQKEIDPIYYRQTYHVVPDPGAIKAYELLLEAMRRAGKVAIARLVLRTRQHVAALRPRGDVLALATMYYADEVLTASRQDSVGGLPRAPSLGERELTMAGQLVEALAAEFDPTAYRDEHRERVMALIQRKAEGRELVTPPSPPERGEVIDLVSALSASLARTAPPPTARPKANAKPRARRRGHRAS